MSNISLGSDEGGSNHTGWEVFQDSAMAEKLGVRDFNGIMGDVAAFKKRQHILDTTRYKKEFKTPNPGKPPQNKDPYPVDLKIEELEAHMPVIKQYEVTTHVHGQAATVCAMSVGDNAEKRIVKLENMCATMLRYIMRLGARVPINCVYYGGQSPFEKYKCIRCLKDDRIGDGQNVQIDQCMSCTRYEPVYGQCYEILNDIGANVAAILDDNQMGYTNMKEYVELTRNEETHDEKEDASISLATVETRESNDTDFSKSWGEGIKMKWDYVPKEDQKCHINWRQSINDDGSNIGRLASFPGAPINSGNNLVKKPDTVEKAAVSNKNSMDNYTGTGKGDISEEQAVKDAIASGKSVTNKYWDTINEIAGENMADVKEACKNTDYDPVLIASIGFVQGKRDYKDIVTKLDKLSETIGTKNIAVLISAYSTTPDVFLGENKDKEGTGKSNKGLADVLRTTGCLPDITTYISTAKEDENNG